PKLAAAYGQASPTTPTAARSAPHRRPRDDEFLHPPTHPTPGTEPQSGPVTPRRRPTPTRRTTPVPDAATRQRPRRRPPRLRRSRRADMPARALGVAGQDVLDSRKGRPRGHGDSGGPSRSR